MKLKTRVKVNGITNLHDARYCAGMGVEMIGFPVNGENALPPEQLKEITSWLSGVDFVAELSNNNPVALDEFPAKYIQLAQVEQLGEAQTQTELPLILPISYSTQHREWFETTLSCLKTAVQLFIVSSEEHLDEATQTYFRNMASEYSIFLAFGIDKDNVLEVLERVQPEGIALNPGQEIKLGHNDFDHLADILEQLEEDY